MGYPLDYTEVNKSLCRESGPRVYADAVAIADPKSALPLLANLYEREWVAAFLFDGTNRRDPLPHIEITYGMLAGCTEPLRRSYRVTRECVEELVQRRWVEQVAKHGYRDSRQFRISKEGLQQVNEMLRESADHSRALLPGCGSSYQYFGWVCLRSGEESGARRHGHVFTDLHGHRHMVLFPELMVIRVEEDELSCA